MRLDAKPGQGRQHHGMVHRVLRNGSEVSAWSERGEAERALEAALAEEAAAERSRLPANARDGLQVTATGITFEAGGVAMWRAEFGLDQVRGPRGIPGN